MPLTYRVDVARRLVLARASGMLSGDDIAAYQQALWSQPEAAGFNECIDMSAAAGVALDSVERLKEVALRAALKDSLLDAPRLAIIAPQDSVFGIARMYEAYRRGAGGTKDVGVFRRADEAAQYLGIPAEALQGDPPRDS